MQKNCKNCLKGRPMILNTDIICSLNGIVTADYLCGKYRVSNSLEFNVWTKKCSECSNFVFVEERLEGVMGTCILFTIRKFNGTTKKACAKISSLKV